MSDKPAVSKGHAIARALLKIEAVRLRPQEPFQWSSGLYAPIYCDNRLTLAYPEIRSMIADGFAAALREEEWRPDAIAGTATAGIPHAALLSERVGLPMAYVRSRPKAHGRGRQIEGRIDEGQRVVLVEDLISTGGSALEAVEALREHGAVVCGVLAIFSYGFSLSASAFADADCTLRTLTSLDDLLAVAQEGGLDSDDLRLLSEWRGDPDGWSREHAPEDAATEGAAADGAADDRAGGYIASERPAADEDDRDAPRDRVAIPGDADLEEQRRSARVRHAVEASKEPPEFVLGRTLMAQEKTLAVAESCTGGAVVDRLTDISGASSYVRGGVVAYSNGIKTGQLGVDADALETEGAVSETVALQMARGARERLGADIGISTTGIAGPTGGTADKPVGTVWIGVDDGVTSVAKKFQFGQERIENKEATVQACFDMLMEMLQH